MTTVWAGLTLGSVFAIVALGYNVVFVGAGMFNFAHAQFVMFGTFLAYWGLVTLKWPVALVIAIAGLIVASLGIAEERVAIRLLRPHDLTGQLVTTVGAGVLLDGVATLIWGSDPLPVPFLGSSRPLTLLGGRVLPDGIALLIVAVGLAVILHLVAHRTKIGIAALGATEDREAATLRGVNIRMLSIGAFALSGLIAGLVGVVIGPQTYAYVSVDLVLALNGFVALAIGGFGSQLGVLLGGLIIGVVEEQTARYAGPNYQDLIVFGLLLVVLIIRPTGLFGARAGRMV